MGLISGVLAFLFGGGRNVVRETAEIFRENADAGTDRDIALRAQTMAQFGTEFQVQGKGRFDRLMDGLNRLPRPALALGTLSLFVAAMIDPLWFAARMQGIALVPEPLWWLLGVVVSFYFGARHQAKSQELQREITATMRQVPTMMANLDALNEIRGAGSGTPNRPEDNAGRDTNPALEDWRRLRGS